jgi:hypothetical protein
MNKKLIRLTESDLHKIVKESVSKIINEIGDTPKGQDALGQVRGRADKRSKLLGGAMGNKYRKISHDAQEKAYSQGEKHGFDIYDPNGAYDKGISKGYEKALAKEPRLHKIVKEDYNPFDNDDFEEWDRINVSPISDEEYNEIMRMNPMQNSSYIFNKIGFNKWNGFVSRWGKENPEECERFWRSQMAF